MKRRDLLKIGAVTAGAAAAIPGCVMPRLLGDLEGPDGAAFFTSMLDGHLDQLDKPGLLQRIVAKHTKKELSPKAVAKIAPNDAMFRQMLGTLLISQGFRDLTPEVQAEAAVQERIWQHMDRIDSSVFEMNDMLSSLAANERANIQSALREDPELPMVIGEALDKRAATVGMSRQRRRQLRKMMSQTSFRLRNTDPSAVIDEYSEKVAKLRDNSAQDATALALAEDAGQQEFWRHQHLVAGKNAAAATKVAQGAPGSTSPDTDARDLSGVSPNSAAAPPKKKQRAGAGGAKAGAYMLGISIVIGIVSIAAIGASEAFLVGLTIAVLLFGIGLLTLLISAIMYAADG